MFSFERYEMGRYFIAVTECDEWESDAHQSYHSHHNGWHYRLNQHFDSDRGPKMEYLQQPKWNGCEYLYHNEQTIGQRTNQ